MKYANINVTKAQEIASAITDAVDACKRTGKGHSVVYSEKLGAAVSMPTEPHLDEYGWEMITNISV